VVGASNQGGDKAGSLVSIDGLQVLLLEESNMIQLERKWLSPPTSPAPMPVGLIHVDSNVCWCEPVIETDGLGEEVVLHRHITWN